VLRSQTQQRSTQLEQIDQSTSDGESLGILEQAPVADLGEAEDDLEDQERMLAPGADAGLGAVLAPLDLIDPAAVPVAAMRKVLGARGSGADDVALSLVGRVAPHPRLFPVQQFRQQTGVVYVGGGSRHRVDDLGGTVNADVRLHAEVPLVAFLGLVHLRVPLPALVLGRGWGADDRRIDDGAGADLEALARQVAVDRAQDRLAQRVRFQQVAELADRGLVGGRFSAQIDTDKLAHGARVVQRLFHRRVRQVEPVLQEMDAQHPLQSDGRAARTLGGRVMRLDQRYQLGPRHHRVHLGQKLRPPGHLVVLRKPRLGQCHLLRPHPVNLAHRG
jgi:hypothetical protein